MAPQNLNDYERRRLDNIRRNNEMMAALKLHSAASQLSKRSRVTTKSEKKPKAETPVVIRRSLRAKGIPPDSNGLREKSPKPEMPQTLRSLALETLASFPMSDACIASDSDRSFIESIVCVAEKEAPDDGDFLNDARDASDDGSCKGKRDEVTPSFELGSMSLDVENIAKVVPGRITVLKFFPSNSVNMIAASDNTGNIGFWDVRGDERRRLYLYRPHQTFVSGLSVQSHCLSKIFTSCYDGFVRLMDAEKEAFNVAYCSNECIYSLNQPATEANCLYFAEGSGVLTVWDIRMQKCSSQWAMHDERINTIDFNCENPHIVATSSADGTACTWDLRYGDRDKLTALRTLTHKRGVQSAYFSPSGCSLATTSCDNVVSIYGGVNLEDAATVYHDNLTSLSRFRAIWGWDDSYLFIGNVNRGVDVVSTVQRKTVMTLQSPHMSAIQVRLEAHPYNVGMLAGGSTGGRIYILSSS